MASDAVRKAYLGAESFKTEFDGATRSCHQA